MPHSDYYNLDAILAEEELLPCNNLFEFSYLSHLDPDLSSKQHVLPENSRIKMPMWAVEKWAMLGFVQLSLPRHFGRKTRERLEADPSEVDLRKRNERYFVTGRRIIDLMEQANHKVLQMIKSQGRVRRNTQTVSLEKTAAEAAALRLCLLQTYTGDRLCQTLDWALSSVGDDVTIYTSKLTELERKLFAKGAVSATMHQAWKLHGRRRLVASKSKTTTRAVTPEGDENDELPETKKQRTA